MKIRTHQETTMTNPATGQVPATEETPEDATRRLARRLYAIERLCSGRPGYHTITVKALLTAMSDADDEQAAEEQPAIETDAMCRCGHGRAYHDAKYADPQCRLCPEDGERMWRHAFTPATETLRCACTHTRSIHTGPHLFCAVPDCECERYAGARQDGARP